MTTKRNFKTSNKVFTVPYTDAAALGAVLSGDVKLFTLPAGSVVKRTALKPTVAFVGAATVTARVITANHNYGTAYDVKQAPGAEVVDSDLTPFREKFGSAVDVKVHFVSTVQNLSALTAGELQVIVTYDVENFLS